MRSVREQNKVHSLAREYSQQGYAVQIEPTLVLGNDIAIPDLIAEKNGRKIIMLVGTQASLKELGISARRLARYAEENDNVRLDLILVEDTTPKRKNVPMVK